MSVMLPIKLGTHWLPSGSSRRPSLSVGHVSLLFSTSTAGRRGRKKGERPRMAPRMAFTLRSAKESKSLPGGGCTRFPCVSTRIVFFQMDFPKVSDTACMIPLSSASTRYKSSRSTYSTTSMDWPLMLSAIFRNACRFTASPDSASSRPTVSISLIRMPAASGPELSCTSFTKGEMISASACSLKACTRATVSPNKLFTVLLLPTLDLPSNSTFSCLNPTSFSSRKHPSTSDRSGSFAKPVHGVATSWSSSSSSSSALAPWAFCRFAFFLLRLLAALLMGAPAAPGPACAPLASGDVPLAAAARADVLGWLAAAVT
mmetsp:Transcript_1755/g.3998  ORF Transcript_1755/g.3998 Transcript_1755/m.3998 type:complete len:316 (-) Transcript_1755:1128-2075(-)